VYHFIVLKRGTTVSYLIGYGLIIPLALHLPYTFMEALDLQNKVLKMSFFPLPTVVVFRAVEAMHDTSPCVVESSLATYMVYYSSAAHFIWDPETGKRRKMTGKELTSVLLKILMHSTLAVLLLSFLLHYDFQPFPSTVKLEKYHFEWELFSLSHILNAYCLALLTYALLCAGFEAMGLASPGLFYARPTFLSPLLSSRSPADFWGRRWNLMLHRTLKHGVYLPAMKGGRSKLLPTILTFACSGLWHDYVWTLIFYQLEQSRDPSTGRCDGCFSPMPLKVTAFFLWNGLLVVLERPCGKYLQPFTKHLPTPLVSTLVLLLALPISHWYNGDWAIGGLFRDFSIALLHIEKVK
jgi:hypothetical protein